MSIRCSDRCIDGCYCGAAEMNEIQREVEDAEFEAWRNRQDDLYAAVYVECGMLLAPEATRLHNRFRPATMG